MKWKVKKIMKNSILLTLFTLFLTHTIQAQTAEDALNLITNESGFGIRAASMGNAFTALADDYSAVYWNPAGLAQSKNTIFSGGLYNLSINTDTDYLGNITSGNRNYTKFQSIGFVFPFPVSRGAFSIAAGYQRVQDLDQYIEFTGYNTNSSGPIFDFGQDELIPFDKNIQQTQKVASEGYMSQWSIAAAMDLSPNLSGGITINFIGGKETYTSDYFQEDIYNHYEIFPSDLYSYNYKQTINSTFSGVEYKFGGLWRFGKIFRFAGTITFPYGLTVEENWSENDNLAYDNGDVDASDLGDGYFDYIIKQPFKFSAGVSIHSPALILSGSATYIDWRQTRYEIPDDADPYDYEYLMEENVFFQNDYRAVLSYSAGAELRLFSSKRLRLRAGYRYLPSPLNNVDTEYDKQYYSGGIAYQIDINSTFEVSYVRGMWKTNTAYYYTDYASQNITTEKYLAGLVLRF